MSKNSRLISWVALAVATVGGLGYFMIPNHREIALMQLSDRDYSLALQNYSVLHESGDHSLNVISPLVNISVYYGDIDKAIKLLLAYLDENPTSVEARKTLAEMYRSSQRYDHYCAVLEDLQKYEPSSETLRFLATNYEFLGRPQEEKSALERLIKSPGYQKSTDDYLRLATFLRMDGRGDDAIKLLREIISAQGAKVEPNAIYMVTQLLIEAGQPAEAEKLASDYLKKTDIVARAVAVSSIFETSGQTKTAYDILAPFMGQLDQSPILQQQVVNLLLSMKKTAEAKRLLIDFRNRGILPVPLTPTLLDLAVTDRDYDTILAVLRSGSAAQLPEEDLLRFASIATQTSTPAIAEAIRDAVGADYIKNTPLLAAILNVAIKNTPEALKALDSLPVATNGSTSERLALAGVYLAHDNGKKAFTLVQRIPIAHLIDAIDANGIADLYLKAGTGNDGAKLLSDARPDSPPHIQEVIDRTLFLLAVGMGHADDARQRAQAVAANDPDLIAAAVDIAGRYHHPALAVDFALTLYRQEPSDQNRLQMALALIEDGKLDDAIDYMPQPPKKNAALRARYFDVISAWVGKAQELNPPLAQKREVEKLLAAAVASNSEKEAARDDLPYLFVDLGSFDQAEKLFIAEADKAANDSPAVGELLSFWQAHPSTRAGEWLRSRARNAPNTTKAAWLVRLNDLGFPHAVIDAAGDEWKSSYPIAESVLEALINIQEKQRLDQVLRVLIDGDNNPAHLKKFADLAEQDGSPAAENGWRKLHQLNPEDADAAMYMGFAAYSANRFDEAEPLLAAALRLHPTHYRLNYAYGDILQQADKKQEAMPYFERSLKALADRKDISEEEKIDQAHLLFFTGKLQPAYALFRRMIEQRPQDRSLRASFAEILMQGGDYDEASRVLAQ